jgi:hypothetical protein
MESTPLLLKVTEAAKLLQLGRDRIYSSSPADDCRRSTSAGRSGYPGMLSLASSNPNAAKPTSGARDGGPRVPGDRPANGPRTPRGHRSTAPSPLVRCSRACALVRHRPPSCRLRLHVPDHPHEEGGWSGTWRAVLWRRTHRMGWKCRWSER